MDSVDSGGKYRDVKALQLTVDGTPVEIPVADYRMQINTVGRDTGVRQQGESVTARVPVDTLERLLTKVRDNVHRAAVADALGAGRPAPRPRHATAVTDG